MPSTLLSPRFLDEPLSGLDSYAAYTLVVALKVQSFFGSGTRRKWEEEMARDVC